jgi:hypothetical protein
MTAETTVTAQPAEHEVAAALLALRHRAGGPPSAGPSAGSAPEAAWRRTRLAALGLLPRFPPR